MDEEIWIKVTLNSSDDLRIVERRSTRLHHFNHVAADCRIVYISRSEAAEQELRNDECEAKAGGVEKYIRCYLNTNLRSGGIKRPKHIFDTSPGLHHERKSFVHLTIELFSSRHVRNAEIFLSRIAELDAKSSWGQS